MDNNYGLPSGKVDEGESYTQAAIREAKEEVGVSIKESDLRYVHTSHRRDPDSDWVDIYFETSIWEGEPYNAEPHLHSALEWIDIKALPENVIKPVRDALTAIDAGNAYSEYGW